MGFTHIQTESPQPQYKMGRAKELTVDERETIVRLKAEGMSNRAVAKRLGRSEAAVRYFLKAPELTKRKKRTGRPRKIDSRTARHIFRLATLKDMSAPEIAKSLSSRPSKSTVLRALRNNKFVVFAKRKPAPALKTSHKKNRCIFAGKHEEWRTRWQRVVFTDEKKFNLDGPDGFRSYWRDLRHSPKIFSRRVSGGGSVMIWAGVSYFGKTDVVFLKGKQNAEAYTKTLTDSLLPFLENHRSENPTFQQDNASIHAAKLTKAFLKDRNIETLDWPSKSPDLNVIENVWGVLARRVYANGRQFSTVFELQKVIAMEWARIDQEYVRKLIKSMPKRMRMVLCHKGAPIPY